MASWVLIPCLKTLFAEFDRIAPMRDKASDGSIGDTAHSRESSDHNADETGNVPVHDADKVNEVHAIDVDNTLNESDLTMEKVVQFLLGRCRSGAEKRLRYIIYNRRIWSAKSNWVEKKYKGASPHTEHAHFSASYESKYEASTASWHLEDIPVALTAADKTWVGQEIGRQLAAFFKVTAQPKESGGLPESKIGHDALSQGIPNPITGKTGRAYEVIGDLGDMLKSIDAKVTALGKGAVK